MNRFRNLVAIFAFSLLVLALPVVASAQWRNDRNNRNDNDYYGNNRNNRNLQATIRNLKSRSRTFERVLDRELDRSRYDGRNSEDRLNDLAKEFRNAVNNLDNYDNRRNYNNNSSEIRRVLQIGNQLDRALSRARLGYNVQSMWSQIRQDLRSLADSYNYNGNRNRRNNRDNDDWDY